MTEQPKRRGWFQLHLSTCVVLMFVAGILIHRNVALLEAAGDGTDLAVSWYARYGFPFTWRVSQWWQQYPDNPVEPDDAESKIMPWGVAGNFVSCASILFLIGWLVESLIRRRERRRQEAMQ